jgi:DNA-binding MarR family transcriptional regulator
MTSTSNDSDDVEAALAALRSVVLASQGFRLRFAEQAGIGAIDSVAMSHLAAAGTLTIGDLAERVGLAPSGATALVDRLERARLVLRVVRPENRRTVGLTLTPEGLRLLERGAEWARQAVLGVGAEQLPELARLLNLVADGLNRSADGFSAAARSRGVEQAPPPIL